MGVTTKNSLLGIIADKLGLNKKFHKSAPLKINLDSDLIVSPVEAKVKVIGKVNSNREIVSKGNRIMKLESLLGKYAPQFAYTTYINFYLNPSDKHYWIAPYDAEVVYAQKREGTSFFPVLIGLENITGISMMDKAIKRNASISAVLETEKFPIAMVALGSLNVNRIHADYSIGRRYRRGEECGYFSIGSSMLLFFPNYLEILVKEKDKVEIGQKILRIKN